MARWEYCRLSWAAHAGAPEALDSGAGDTSGRASAGLDRWQQHGHPGLLERLGSEAPAERITRLDATIARLGRAGWELVSHVQLQEAGLVQHWYFKRELTDVTRSEF
jgi:hypothetical protein